MEDKQFFNNQNTNTTFLLSKINEIVIAESNKGRNHCVIPATLVNENVYNSLLVLGYLLEPLRDFNFLLKYSHAEAPPIPIDPDLMLDIYSGATSAYSIKRLRKGYDGPCIRVRRTSDNTLKDIGFVNNNVDEVDLLSFVGAGSGFVQTYYDQMGNFNLTQNTNNQQPRVVLNGVPEKENDQLVIRFLNTSSTHLLSTDTFANPTGLISMFSVVSNFTIGSIATVNSIGTTDHLAQFRPNAVDQFIYARYRSLRTRIIPFPDPIPIFTFSSIFTGTQIDGYLSGVGYTTTTVGTTTDPQIFTGGRIQIGRITGTNPASMFHYATIIYLSNQTNNRIGIENELTNNFY